MIRSVDDIRRFLFDNSEQQYRDFSHSLLPTIDKSRLIGVRAPVIRKLAKSVGSTDTAQAFVSDLPHRYYEENNLHGYLVANQKDFHTAIKMVEKFLPYVDNWATCDNMRPKVFSKHLDLLYPYVLKFVQSSHTYTVRYGVGLLNSYYLDDGFEREHLELVCGIKSDEYYIDMMIAWYMATALFMQYDTAIEYIENKRLKPFVHNKAIQKACESFRVTDEHKEYLRTLKIRREGKL